MNQRIELLLRIKDVTASKFADMIGVQPSNISHIISGRNKPSLDFIIKVVEAFPDISLEWLMFGKGNMYSQMNVISAEKEIEQLKLEVEKLNKVNTQVDLFSELETTEISKNQDINTEELINEKDKDLKNQNFSEISQQDVDLQHDNIEINKDEVEIEKPSEIIKPIEEKIFDKKLSEEKTTIPFQDLPLKRKDKPERIIFVYSDSSFEIIDNRK